MFKFLQNIDKKGQKQSYGALDVIKYIGPGLMVTVGFIDPGNWASNLAAGADYGYQLLWMVSLSTIMLIILQHNVAHLGIVTGLCLSEAATKYLNPKLSRTILISAMMASISTSLAEILGGAIALQMLFDIPIPIGALLVTIFSIIMLFTNSYTKVEKWIIAFVSLIGISFLYELSLIAIDWNATFIGWVKPTIPQGSIMIIMSVMGAVVMPHNLFLHSEIIQSRQWNLEEKNTIDKQLKFEFFDTLFSMIIGWAINSAMIILATTTFHKTGATVTQLEQAKSLLEPLLGNNAGKIFAFALLMAGIASTITSGIAAGSIFAGMFNEHYDRKDNHSKLGILISFTLAFLIILSISNPFKSLIISQMVLSIQLPITIFLQIYLTSSKNIMGEYRNDFWTKTMLYTIATIITILNFLLAKSLIFG